MTTDQTMRALADAATDGPWRVWHDPDPTKLRDTAVETAWCHGDIDGDTELITDYLPTDEDAEFIAAAREWVPDAIRRIERVREIHQPIKALNTRYPGGKLTQVCTGCGQDDGNWNQWPCATIRALDGDK